MLVKKTFTDSPSPKFTCLTLGWDLIMLLELRLLSHALLTENAALTLLTFIMNCRIVHTLVVDICCLQLSGPGPHYPVSLSPPWCGLCPLLPAPKPPPALSAEHSTQEWVKPRQPEQQQQYCNNNNKWRIWQSCQDTYWDHACHLFYYISHTIVMEDSKRMSLSIKMLLKKSFINKEVS